MLNDEQQKAIENALKCRFYLIHGPPGTGKTVVGIQLAYCFVKLNNDSNKRNPSGISYNKRQVLYCGPSNRAVDVAAGKLNESFSGTVIMVRVYNRTWERLAYPVPRDSLEFSSPSEENEEFKQDENVATSRALHHLIRRHPNPYSVRIREFDDNFRANLKTPEKVRDFDIREQEKLIRLAEAVELKAADIVFCTCISSASTRITKNVHVRQIIIDECGMSTEPDCFVPLTSFHDAEQVVLIGDHLQLQPIVNNHEARRLGLGRSLFERYYENSNSLIMLQKQYRMHQSICDFPSKYFYKGRLETAFQAQVMTPSTLNLWPQSSQRIVFCDLEGTEEDQKVATAEGNLFSKSNKEEQVHAIRILQHLHNECHIPMASIAVLSPYRAQCFQLRRQLQTGCKAHVSTVVASQGEEWDYVILTTVRSLSLYRIDTRPDRSWISKHLGSVADPHQINVALTRAKQGLIIIGNKNLLEVVPMWKALIDDYIRKGCLLDVQRFPPSS